MKRQELQSLVIECLQEYFVERHSQPIKENTMKKSELKALVNEIVRQVVKEAGPQYKVRDGRSYVEQPGKVNRAREIQSDPMVNEVAPEGWEGTVKAMKSEPKIDNPWALAHWMKGKGYSSHKEAAVPGEGEGMEDHPYDEQEEIEILKRIALDLIRLLKMHNAMEEPEAGPEEPVSTGPPEGGPKPPPFEPEAETEPAEEPAEEPVDEPAEKPPFPPKKKKEKEEGDEDLDENHKVQARSHRTIKDVPQNPLNVRNPKVPAP